MSACRSASTASSRRSSAASARPSGALAGGVLLGAVQALAIVIFGAGYKNVVALSVLLLVLLVFPSGVFGGRGGEKH